MTNILSDASMEDSEPSDSEDAKAGYLEAYSLQRYLLVCCQGMTQDGQGTGGGLKDKPGKYPDYYHTCYGLSGLSVAQVC